MADQTPPRGLIADLVTPLKSDGTIDGRGLERLLDRAIPCVEAAFLASPHAGEGETLTPGQRSELVEKAIVVIRGRIPLMIWVTRETEEKTLDTILSQEFLYLHHWFYEFETSRKTYYHCSHLSLVSSEKEVDSVTCSNFSNGTQPLSPEFVSTQAQLLSSSSIVTS